jgi:trehalose 6-phosphate synthase
MQGKKFVIVSNREPYTHVRDDRGIRAVRNVGGLTVALDSVAQSLGGLWVAYGHGSADREAADEQGRVPAPPDDPSYTLRRVWLTESDYEKYYSGFSNGALWPLCHIVHVRPRFHLDEWDRYREVNERFARAVLEEIGDDPAFIFIQDYHLALAAGYIKSVRPDADVALFWHIPYPNPEILRVLPWRAELLEGMLANDLVGFHTREHALNFMNNVSDTLEARIDTDKLAVFRGGNRTWVRSFPIGVDVEHIEALASADRTRQAVQTIRQRFGIDEDCTVGVGVDRMDYTKGIPERFEALERMLEKHPEWVGRFVWLQIAVPSRIELQEYRDVHARAIEVVDRINRRFARKTGLPPGAKQARTVHLIEDNLDFRDVVPYYRLADLCAITSLHDGMNLVAKEYVAAKTNLDGALVLSPFAGAARELERTWLASPYDREVLADTYHMALTEPLGARRARMAALRETLQRHNIYDWAMELFDSLSTLTLRTPEEEEWGMG